ncbi:hypothetical protein FACS189449_10680 [Alphaproteobacteria bacterium]|nr:hypothetical protein FACS189449_10680 [Alphaproteobacteria bacterium]
MVYDYNLATQNLMENLIPHLNNPDVYVLMDTMDVLCVITEENPNLDTRNLVAVLKPLSHEENDGLKGRVCKRADFVLRVIEQSKVNLIEVLNAIVQKETPDSAKQIADVTTQFFHCSSYHKRYNIAQTLAAKAKEGKKLGQQVVAALTLLVGNNDSGIRETAIRFLETALMENPDLATNDLVDAVTLRLKDRDSNVRSAAFKFLNDIQDFCGAMK